jgi:peptide/nickel transport system substrate-binding protein
MNTRKLAGGLAAGGLLASVALAATITTTTPASAQQTLKVGTWGMPGGRGNPFTARGTPSIFVWSPLFDRLSGINGKGEVVPDAAQSWSNVNPTTWRVTLKEGGSFSNGEKFDAAAVKATFDYLLTDEGKATPVGQWVNDLASVSAVDAKTLEFVTKAPTPIWPTRLAVVFMVAPKAWADLGAGGFAAAPVGSGPYKVTRLGPESVSMEAHDGALRKRANISKLEIVGLPEAPTRTQALQSGQIDIDTDVAVDSITALKAQRFVIDSVPASQVHGFSFITAKEGTPWKDKRLRQAANYAVNKQAIVDNIYGGQATVASQHAAPISFGYNPDVKPYPYDPAMAKKLLAEAGYPNGIDLTMNVVNTTMTLTNATQQVANDLTAAGIRTKLVTIPIPELIGKFLNGGWAPEIEAFNVGTDHTGHLDAGVGFSSFYSCAKKVQVYCEEAEMPLINAAATEFNVDKRRQLLRDVLKMNHDNAPLIFMAEQRSNMGYHPKVKNFKNEVFVLNIHEMRIEP